MDDATDLPVRPAAYAVLLALAEAPRAGFEVMERANASLPGRPILGPGSLYRLLRELRRAGWVERVPAPGDPEEETDDRRSYHALTDLGRQVVRAETARLLRAMRAAGVLGGGAG
jgi:DNA-binding PadR family transcriptional regulator